MDLTLETTRSGFSGDRSEMDTSVPNRCNIVQTTYTILNVLCHFLILFVTAYHLIFSFRDMIYYTRLHMLFSIFGYVLLMSEAIMSITDENLWSKSLTRRTRSHVHWIFQVIGAGLNLAGFLVMFLNKKKHFKSVHAIVGLISYIGIIVLAFSGVPALFAARIRKIVRPVISKFIHNFLGIACYVLGMVAIILAYEKKTYRSADKTWFFWCTVSTYLVTILSLLGAVRSLIIQIVTLCSCQK